MYEITYGRFGEKVSGSVFGISKYMRVGGGSGCVRQRSLNSIVKFYGVDCSTMPRGGVGNRTTAVVFRHLASFSELPQRKEVCTEEQVWNGERVREIRERVGTAWGLDEKGQVTGTSVNSAHRYRSITVTTPFLQFPTGEKLDGVKTWKSLE